MSPAATLKLVLATAIAGMAITEVSAAPGDAACNALPQQDAAALMGGPLESNFRNETAGDAVNGHDHTTVCGWFPKGFDIKSAGAPPERGVLLTLHTFRTSAEAKQFHDMTKHGVPGTKQNPVPGVGLDAVSDEKTFSGIRVATVRFLKGTHAAQVQTWSKEKGVDAATAAAKQVVAKI